MHAWRLEHGAVVLGLMCAVRVVLVVGVWVVVWGLGERLQALVDCRGSSGCTGLLDWVQLGSVVWAVKVQDEARSLVRGWLWLVG